MLVVNKLFTNKNLTIIILNSKILIIKTIRLKSSEKKTYKISNNFI